MARHLRRSLHTLSDSQLFENNRDAAVGRNISILKISLISAIVVYALTFLASFAADSLTYMRTSYIIITAICVLLLVTLKYARPRLGLAFTYTVYGVLIAYSIITSAFVSPNYVCITVLAFIFQFQVLYLDKSWRINLASVLSAAVYLAVIYWFKAPELLADEFVNVIGFLILGFIIGSFTRRAQLENFNLKRTLEGYAYTDQLTRLPNRRSFFELLANSEKQDCTAPIAAFAMIDIDSFKLYNDTYGHQSGDECLRRVGGCFRRFSDESDIDFYRYGGEEFVAVNTSHTQEKFIELCGKVRQQVEQLEIENADDSVSYVTISVGVACLGPLDGRRYEALLLKADKALYYAKSMGRNTVVCYTDKMVDIHPVDTAAPSFRARN